MTAVLTSTAELPGLRAGTVVSATVTLEGAQRLTTRQGRPWAAVLLAPGLEVLVFPNEYAAFKHLLTDGVSVTVTGRIDHQPGLVLLMAETIEVAS